ncbi:PAS domain S-box protein [Sesbania bispinosa]|nr:PAS domain S-box protein [Sesbania bispinosa]
MSSYDSTGYKRKLSSYFKVFKRQANARRKKMMMTTNPSFNPRVQCNIRLWRSMVVHPVAQRTTHSSTMDTTFGIGECLIIYQGLS